MSNNRIFTLAASGLFILAVGCSDRSDSSALDSEQAPLVITLADGGTEETCSDPKVLVCHIPPGNPANAHSICISTAAQETHITHHGDTLGGCAETDGGVEEPAPEAAPEEPGDTDAPVIP